jgi:restriction system protein
MSTSRRSQACGAQIACRLRPDVGAGGYSGDQVIKLANQILAKAFRGSYPVEIDSVQALVILGDSRQFSTANEIVSLVEPMIAILEAKLATCEANP